ncbi:MAG: hypothetical protein ABSC26_06075 [Stellaceae bacterium]|jgi:hypothetical protein
MRWWRKVRYAEIPNELRDRFELFGEDILAQAFSAAQWNSVVQGVELINLIQSRRPEIIAWLRERRDLEERREQRVETLEWAILIFVGIEVVHDLPSIIGWLLGVQGGMHS